MPSIYRDYVNLLNRLTSEAIQRRCTIERLMSKVAKKERFIGLDDRKNLNIAKPFRKHVSQTWTCYTKTDTGICKIIELNVLRCQFTEICFILLLMF